MTAANRPSAPCGTDAAHKRHRRRGEKPCEACRAAHRAYNAQWMARRRAEYPVGLCAACDRERPIQRRDWCESCITRWQNAGRPESGPPPLDPRAPQKASARARRQKGEALREDFAFLLDTGESVEMAATRVGIAASTADAWHQQWQRQKAVAA